MEVILMDTEWKCGYWSVVTRQGTAGHSQQQQQINQANQEEPQLIFTPAYEEEEFL